MSKKSYTVHRAMHGDGRDWARGDVREMAEVDAAPLVATGALSVEGEEPAARAQPVEHLFGRAPVDSAEYVPAITDAAVSDSRVEGRRSPSRRG